jgi:hypothetical protein
VVVVAAVAVPVGVARALPPTTAQTATTSASRAQISATEILARATSWVARAVPYSQAAQAADPEGHPYRTDCSGFVSMAWRLSGSLTTQSLPSVARPLGAIGDYSGLQPGDMLDSTWAGHAVLFVRWTDHAHHVVTVMEESHPGTPAHQDVGYYTTTLLAAEHFVAYRYQGVTANAPVRDWTGDGRADLVARRSADGTLWLYPGLRTGGFGPPRLIGTGWQVMTSVVEVRDWGGRSQPALVGLRADGQLWLFPGDGRGGFGAPRLLAKALVPAQVNLLVFAGDLDGDGAADLLARQRDGGLWLLPGDGKGGIGAARRIGTGWNAFTTVVSPGDVTGDGYPDLLGRRGDGSWLVLPGRGGGRWDRLRPFVGLPVDVRPPQPRQPSTRDLARAARHIVRLHDQRGHLLPLVLPPVPAVPAPLAFATAAVSVRQAVDGTGFIVSRTPTGGLLLTSLTADGVGATTPSAGQWRGFDLVL